ncbi:putative ATP-dependent RNA helicase DDX60 [Mustelus asterias]
MEDGSCSDCLDEDNGSGPGEEESDSPGEGEAESLDEEAMVKMKLRAAEQLSDATEERRLDELLSEISTCKGSGEAADTLQAGAEGLGGAASDAFKKSLHYLSWYLTSICAKSQKVSLLRDFVESEFFVIDGDSLMMMFIHDASLDLGQNLHFFYLVECFLFDLSQRMAKYVITFFKDTECMWNENCLYLSIRTALILHLQHNTKVPVHTEFSNCFDSKWKRFLQENNPYFIIISDKAFPQRRRHLATGMFHILMLHTLGHKVNVVLSSGMSQDILRVHGYHTCSKPAIVSLVKKQEAALRSIQVQLVNLAPKFSDHVFQNENEEELVTRMQSEIHLSYSRLKGLWPLGSDISKVVCAVSCSVALNLYACQMTTAETAGQTGRRTEDKEDGPQGLAIPADICRMYCLHVALLQNLPLPQRALKCNSQWTGPADNFLLLRRMVEYIFLKKLPVTGWNLDLMYLTDLSDKQLMRTIAKMCTEVPACAESEQRLGSKIGGEYRHIWETVAKISPDIDVGPAFPVTCTRGIVLPPASDAEPDTTLERIPTIGLIPMTSALAEEFVGDLLEQLPHLGSEDPALEPLLKRKAFDEVLHWHSRRPLVESQYGLMTEMRIATKDPWKRKRILRGQQKLVVFERLYAETLEENTAVTIVTSQGAVPKSRSKQQPPPIKGNSKKAGIRKKSAQLIIEAQDKKKKQEEERKAKEAWHTMQEPIKREISQDMGKGIKSLEKFLQNCNSDSVKVIAEMEGIECCYKAWVEYCQSKETHSREMDFAVLLMQRIHNVLDRHEDLLTPTILNKLARYLNNLGFLNLRDTIMEMINAKQDQGVKTEVMKDPKFPLGLGASRFQLQYMGPYLFREERKDPDPRVRHFIPDAWQRELLDAVDNNESAVIVAPTSSGKTYASYYCMEKVLRTSDTGIVVYVSPTKALVNQVVATVYGRFNKSLPQGMVVCGTFTRDYRSHVHNCQVLVTVPQCLEILLLSPHMQDWASRIQYVIFDEVHCLGGEIGAEVWEHLLALIRCPFLALSATISNPEGLTQWLQSVKTYWERVENSLEGASPTNTKRKSKKRQQAESRKGSQTFKVRLVTYGERYNDLEKYVCDFENNEYKFVPYHPCAALTVNHIKNYGIPSDLALSPPECLRLYDAMVRAFPKWSRAQELEPEEYKCFKNKVVIRKRDVREYEAELKKELVDWVKAGWKNKVEAVMLLLNPPTEGTFGKNKESNFPLLVETLQKMDLLPALFFAFHIPLVEQVASELLEHLDQKLRSKRKPEDAKTKMQMENQLQKLSKCLEKEETLTNPSKKQAEQLILYRSRYDVLFKKYAKLDELPPDCTFAQISTDSEFMKKVFFRMRRVHIAGYYQRMLCRGIGFHHSSVNRHMRQAVEMLFRRGFIKVVSATSTLALGINMPCRTVVFLQDSVHLDALTYRQMSGRAGRRGMDNIGRVIFLNVPLPKIQRLIKANVPQLKGQFPLSISLVLRLMLLAARADDKGDAKAKALSVLQHSMMTFNQPTKQNIVKFYFLFSLQFLLQEGYLDQEGEPQGFAGLVMHTHYHEPANFVFIRFLLDGLLHKVCQPPKAPSRRFSEDVMETLVLILANLFGRRHLPTCLKEDTITFQQSKVFLDDLPDEFAASVREYNRSALQIFGNFFLSVSNQANLEEEYKLPLSGTSFKRLCLPEANDFCSEMAKASKSPTTSVSPFACLSGHSDFDLFKEDNVDPIVFRTLGIHMDSIPVLYLKYYDRQGQRLRLNAYALDFYKHGCLGALYSDNGLNRGEAFNLIKDFSLVIAAISTSLAELCDNEDDLVVLAFQQLAESYQSKFQMVWS